MDFNQHPSTFPLDPSLYAYSNTPQLGSIFSKLVKSVTGTSLSKITSVVAPVAASLIPGGGGILSTLTNAALAVTGNAGPTSFSIPGINTSINVGTPTAAPYGTLSFTQPDGRVAVVPNVKPGSADETTVKALNAQYVTLTEIAQTVFTQAMAAHIALPQELQAMVQSPQANRLPTTLIEQATYRNMRLQWRVTWAQGKLGLKATVAAKSGGGALIAAALGIAALALL